MMRRIIFFGALYLASSAMGGTTYAQTPRPTNEELMEQLQQMNARIESLESRHRKEHEADQRQIRELEAKVTELQNGSLEAQRNKDISEIREMAQEQASPPNIFDIGGSAGAGINLYNPAITVFFDLGGSVSSDGDNRALNRFNFREGEVDFRAAISPGADGVMIIAIGEEIEQRANGDVDIGSRNVDIEEGYINFHTLPYDLALKVGQFRPAFGINNLLHTHDLPQVDRPLMIQNFLGPEGFHSIGASLSWLVPNPWDKYIELTTEVINSDGGEEAVLLGGPNANNPAVVAHVKFFDDISPTSSIELGGSFLFARTGSDSDSDAKVIGLDGTYTWTDPDPSKFRSFLLQGEAFWAQNDVHRGLFNTSRNTSFGAYVFGQYQLSRDWYVGLRADYSDFPNSEARGPNDSDFALSPYVTWYQSEFLRLRLQYQHRFFEMERGDGDEDALLLQMTFVIGSHPPHPYWVHR